MTQQAKVTRSVGTLSNVQSPRPIDHQMTAVVNQNAEALLEVQALLAAVLSKIQREEEESHDRL